MSVIQQYIRNISQQQHLTAIILPQADTAPHSTELLLASSAYTDFLASLLRCLSQNGFSFCIDSRTTGKVTIRCRPAEGPEETLNIHTEIPLSDGQIAIIDLALLDQKNLPLIAALIQQGSLETAPDRETENLFSQLPGVELHAADNSEQLSAISADIIPVIGPDGVGKTTLITAVQKIAGNSHYYRFKNCSGKPGLSAEPLSDAAARRERL
ncbi:hypothetical protein [Aliamphritea spongicola]|nr:hypothetical protein [Aliamphritea spongicola]